MHIYMYMFVLYYYRDKLNVNVTWKCTDITIYL